MNILLFFVSWRPSLDSCSKLRMKNEGLLIIFTCIFLIQNCDGFKGQHLYQSLLNNYDKDIPAMKGTVFIVSIEYQLIQLDTYQ